jgi:tRNA1Val (adenine37-N6)-methyltransferase
VSSKIKRSLLLFQKNTSPECVPDELILEADRHVYTPEFAVLVKDFYLNL